jgi:hypothetical protein
MQLAPSPQFQSVQEGDDTFLALFPHRYDFLWAEHPNPGDRPDWKTESKYPLSDRHLQQGDSLYGVRFGKLTRYLALDIDRHSAYHPCNDPFAIQRLLAALDVSGLVAYVAVTSSYSGGIHLYFPFEQAQKSWAIALVVSTLLEHAGFKLKPGQLEIFPNPKLYTGDKASLYNGHRLPLQAGSYLLNGYWEQTYSDQAAFVQQWRWAERRNDLHSKAIDRVLKQTKRQRYQVSGGAQKLLDDLHTEIEQGWTEPGQTNRLLGRIAMREYIFGHVQRGGHPLTGQALADAIVAVAVALPGYEEWCRHQHEINKRALEWARSIEADPDHYHYSPKKRRAQPTLEPANNIVPLNQVRALDAERRIQDAIVTLQAANNLPTGATARADAIVAIARCSKQTLQKHRHLWHPKCIAKCVPTLAEPIAATSDDISASPPKPPEPALEAVVHTSYPNKLMPHPAAPQGQAERHQEDGGTRGFSTGQASKPASSAMEPHDSVSKPKVLTIGLAGFLLIEQTVVAASGDSNQVLSTPQSSSAVCSSSPGVVMNMLPATNQVPTEQQRQRQRQQEKTLAKNQKWLESGDSILEKEAQIWFQAQVERQNTDRSES